MDRLQSMRVFQEVADAGSFAAAARKLDLAPAVVTRLVSDLEASLGVRLLQRTTRRLSLTQAGEAYLERLRVILSEIDEAQAMVQAQSREMRGTIRLAATPTIATHVLAPAIARFQRMHPAVFFELVASDVPEASVEDVDLALIPGGAHVDADVILRTVFESHTVLCASAVYLQDHGAPRTPGELRSHRWLRLRMGTDRRPRPVHLTDTRTGERTGDITGTVVFTANSRDALLRGTLLGAGISVQPAELLAPFLQDGSLVRVLPGWICEDLRLSAALPSRQFMPARTRAFLDHLVEFTRAQVGELQEDGAAG